MNEKIVFVCVLICLVSLTGLVSHVKAQTGGAIFINSDGSVSGTNLIQRDGNVYRLTSNIGDSPITVLFNNIVLDGEGFSLQGAGGWGIAGKSGVESSAAINLTCSNVTVRDFNINGWEVGVLGVFNGNTIVNNIITETSRAVAVYADNYSISGNYLANSIDCVRIEGANITIKQNQIISNSNGILITSSLAVTITANNFSNNSVAVNMDNMPPSIEIYQNNFKIAADASIVAVTTDAFPGFPNGGTLPPLDNGAVGNYWSDYAAKYPNATQIGDTGISNTPYLIRTNPTAIDRYPLITPVTIQNITIPSPTQMPTTNLSAETSPSPKASQNSTQNHELTTLIAALTAILVMLCIVVLAFRQKLFWSQN